MYRCLQGIYIFLHASKPYGHQQKHICRISYSSIRGEQGNMNQVFTSIHQYAQVVCQVFSFFQFGCNWGRCWVCYFLGGQTSAPLWGGKSGLFCIGHGANQFENLKNWRLKAWTTKKKMKTTSATSIPQDPARTPIMSVVGQSSVVRHMDSHDEHGAKGQ